MDVSATLPVLLANNGSVRGAGSAVVRGAWTTVGAQFYPAPNVVISGTLLRSFLAANQVVYAAGPAGARIYVVQLV